MAALDDVVNAASESFVIDACIQEVICRDFYGGFDHLANAIVLHWAFFPPPELLERQSV